MRTNRKHIVATWLLLFCFAAGQWAVWSHEHNFHRAFTQSHKSSHKTAVTENCRLCDVMHHHVMAVFSAVYFAPVTVSKYRYLHVQQPVTCVTIVQTAGRAPPMA